MFCSKCGTKAIDGARFCQKCGAKLIQDNREEREPAPVPAQGSVEMAVPSIGASSEPAQEAIYALLKENTAMCPAIKSAKQFKKSVCLRGRIYSHSVRFVTVHTVQARIRSVLAFPFSILYALPAGLFCFMIGIILAELMKYGSICIEYYHVLLCALCCLVTGGVVLIHSCVGRKEKAAVATYVREIAEPKSIYLSDRKRAGLSKIMTAAAAVLVVAGILVLLFNLPEPIEYPDELLFDGLPADRFLEMTQKDIELEFGEADYISQNMITGNDYYGYSYDGFDAISHVTYSKETGKVIYIQFNAFDCSCNRKKLNKSLERVLDILSERYMGGYFSFGVYGSIHNGFYYDGVYFGESPSFEEYLAQQEFEDSRDSNYRFCTLNVYGEKYYNPDWSLDIRDPQDYKIDLITEVNKINDELNGVYYVCLYTDEWVETVEAADASIRNITIDLSYHGESLIEWIGGSPEDAYEIFGWPVYGTIVDGYLYDGGEFFGYNDGVAFIIDYQTGGIGWIVGDAGSIVVNGSALDKTRDELLEILGTPTMEEYAYNEMDDTNFYYMQYSLDEADVLIEMPDSASRAESVTISQVVN